MLQIDGREIRSFQEAGGVGFTAFLDALIRTHACLARINDSEIETNIRTNLPDGGVDTLVRQPDPNDPTGRVRTPTVWQYKATAFRNLESAEELLAGDNVVARIREGFAFRLALADSMPSPTRNERTESLRAICQQINPNSPEPMIVTADDLAAWANRYLGLVLLWFRPTLQNMVLHLDAWRPNVTSPTPTFVRVPMWERVEETLREHLDFSRMPPSVLHTVQGEAGVGKSRLVYQVVSSISGMDGLALYCNDEEASLRVATATANATTPIPAMAVLIADECGPEGRERLRTILQGHAGRVRVIAVDNSGVRPMSPDPELWLDKMPEDSLAQILEVNYTDIPPERRRAYADLARGYPRLAADLCRHDRQILDARGALTAATPPIRDYLRRRLDAEQMQALQALSLMTKIGYGGNVAAELDALCALVGLASTSTRAALRRIHDGPGFVGQTRRYLYVTPEIVAQVGFGFAWQQWARDDPEEFLGRIPEGLLPMFLERVQRSASPEVRRVCGGYFRDWAAHLRADSLADPRTTTRLVVLVDTDPAEYLPRLRRLVEEAPLAALFTITGESLQGQWGPRRALVWLSERFARFPEYYDDSERILARLAAAETEPRIGNNATAIWTQLFRVYLSGAATPFTDRLARLRERLRDPEPGIRALAVDALAALFTSRAIRMAGDPVVGGRIPPAEWLPRTSGEGAECFRAALALVTEAITQGEAKVKAGLLEKIAHHARWFLDHGFLDEIRDLFGRVILPDAQRVALLESVDTFLLYDAPRAPEEAASYLEQVRAWRESLVATDLHSRLLAVVGKARWAASRLRDEEWQGALETLANELISTPGALRAELPWLFGEQARAGEELGVEVGRRDTDAAFFEEIAGTALASPHQGFARGYTRGLMEAHPEHAERVNRWLDQHEADTPLLVAELAIAGGKRTGALERVLRLFDRGALPAHALFPWNFASGAEPLAADQFEELIERLTRAAREGNADALRVGMDALILFVRNDLALLARDRIQRVAWVLVELATESPTLRTHWWGETLKMLAHVDPGRTAHLASRMLLGDVEKQHEAERVLIDLARNYPNEVMEAVGEAILDEKRGWKMHILSFRELVAALPPEVVIAWLDRVGREGARRLARHLPAPHLEGDRPTVPPLTEWVLTKYADDDRLFNAFCAGVHSFQLYSGDIAAQHEAEAREARAFRDHPLARIRQWAELEEREALEDAKRHREEEAEHWLP